MYFRIEEHILITRAYLRAHRHKIFLFGDNLIGRGLGGQAREMRGEPNAIGIPTKRLPSMTPEAFFTDQEFDKNIAAIDRAFDRILRLPRGTTIVRPSNGLGTGRAEMQSRAPKTFAYLNSKLRELRDLP